MATIREYFDTDLKCLSVHADWGMRDNTGAALPSVRARISQDFIANAKYWSFFIPEGTDVGNYATSIFATQETARCVLSAEGDTVYVEEGFADYSERATSTTLVFMRTKGSASIVFKKQITLTASHSRHSRAGWNPAFSYFQELGRDWVPASTGTTRLLAIPLIYAEKTLAAKFGAM